MILFNRYEQNKGKYHISPTLLWEYDLRHFDWQQARSIVVQRVIERGCAEDYFAGIRPVRGHCGASGEILREVSTLSDKDMNFVCTFFNLKKEELRCYTRRLLRRKLLSC